MIYLRKIFRYVKQNPCTEDMLCSLLPLQTRNQKPHRERSDAWQKQGRNTSAVRALTYAILSVCPSMPSSHLPKLQKFYVSDIYWKKILSSWQKLPSTMTNKRETEWLAFFCWFLAFKDLGEGEFDAFESLAKSKLLQAPLSLLWSL